MLKMVCCIAADILALIYLIWPFDIVPDIMPVVGFMDSLFSAAKIARLKKTASLRKRKHRLLTYALFVHQCNSFQNSYFVQLLHFMDDLIAILAAVAFTIKTIRDRFKDSVNKNRTGN